MSSTTVVSSVRHTHVPSVSDAERIPGLSRHGRHDATHVIARLANLADVVATSPAECVRVTVEGVADAADASLIIDNDLRRHELADSPVENFGEAVEHPWVSPDTSYPGGESHARAQARGVAAMDRLVETYLDRRVVVGTHATLMAFMSNACDPRYGREFWTGLMTPDVYEVTFVDNEMLNIARVWTPEETAREGDADRDPTER